MLAHNEHGLPELAKGTWVSGNGISIHCTEQMRGCCDVCNSTRLRDVCSIIHLCRRTAGERSKKWEGRKHTVAAGLNCYWTTEPLPVMEPLFRSHGNVCDPDVGKGRWAVKQLPGWRMDTSGDLWRSKPGDFCQFFTFLPPSISPTVEFPSMEIFTSYLDKVLGSFWSGWLCMSRGRAKGPPRLPSSLRPLVNLGKSSAFKNSHFGLVCLYMPKCHTLDTAFDIFLFLASNSSGHSLWIIKMCAKMCKALANYDVLIHFSRQVWQFWWILIFFRLEAAGKRNKFSARVASVAEHYKVDQCLLYFGDDFKSCLRHWLPPYKM